jgi:hypothetical protein
MIAPHIISKVLAVLSAGTGAVGTWMMYRYSVTLAQFTGYSSPKLVAEIKAQTQSD